MGIRAHTRIPPTPGTATTLASPDARSLRSEARNGCESSVRCLHGPVSEAKQKPTRTASFCGPVSAQESAIKACEYGNARGCDKSRKSKREAAFDNKCRRTPTCEFVRLADKENRE